MIRSSKLVSGTCRWLALLLAVSCADLGTAQVAQPPAAPAYRSPPQAIADLIDAPLTPDVLVSPDARRMLVLEYPSLPPIAELAELELRLAGLRIRPRTNGPSRERFASGLRLMSVSGGEPVPVSGLPPEPRIGKVLWAPDSSRAAFTLTEADGISLWVVEAEDGRARRLAQQLNAAFFEPPCAWVPDGASLICRSVQADRGPMPEAPAVPAGPVIQESLGRKAPAPTYQDLLGSPHDERLLEHYLAAQIVRVGLDGAVQPLGRPGTILEAAPAPDGLHLLVVTLHRPYSYKVRLDRFPHRVEVWNLRGEVLHTVADLPLAEEVPIGFSAVPVGPRDFEWRADRPATLCWAEARDGGDPRAETKLRDEVLCQAAPFQGEPVSLARLELRYAGVVWGSDALALVSDSWWETRRTRTLAVAPGQPKAEPRVVWDRSWEDRYGDPGTPALRSTPQGTQVLRASPEGHLFLLGRGASPEGDRPFLDRFDLGAGTSQRLWRSEAPYYASVQEILDDQGQHVLIRRESNAEPPNDFRVDLKAGTWQQLTRFPHPSPELAGVKKQLIHYERADGVKLNAALYLPPGYDPARDGPLPAVFWVYPREFKSADAAGQVTDSPHRFVRVGWGSALPFLTQGYAVVENPSLPIVGVGEQQPNDTYVEQLVAGAQAAVDAVVGMGVADRSRLGIGGHSYGAFTTANLLAHSDLFRAGIGRSGAYNRTLTPFAFQAEERTFWEARDTYIRVSPLMNADRIDEPLLLIHGEADSNQGTYPMQSERLFDALKGLGGQVRLVLLPHESHGYRARESVLHTWWEQVEWFGRSVKQAAPASSAQPPAGR